MVKGRGEMARVVLSLITQMTCQSRNVRGANRRNRLSTLLLHANQASALVGACCLVIVISSIIEQVGAQEWHIPHTAGLLDPIKSRFRRPVYPSPQDDS
jgi:hypothetical protein